jgi:flagellar basal-body rod protein FlgC
MIRALDISSSALVAQRTRLDVIAGNIANSEVTRQEDGTPIPYRRRVVTFMTGDGRGGPGVHVGEIRPDTVSPFKERYDPGHPDADACGYVQLPNVSITMEYVDAMAASRAYEANAAMMSVTRNMVQQAIRLFA